MAGYGVDSIPLKSRRKSRDIMGNNEPKTRLGKLAEIVPPAWASEATVGSRTNSF